MDNNNLDLVIEFEDEDGNVISYEVLKQLMEILKAYVGDFLDIIISLSQAQKHTDLVRRIMEEYCELFCFEIVMDITDFDEEWQQICRDYGLLPLFYIQCPEDKSFESHLCDIERVMNSVEGRCRAIVFVPANSTQLEYLPELYEIINNTSLKPCFMRLKFRSYFEVSDLAKQKYQQFISRILSQYVLFNQEIVQYYNVLGNVRFRTIESPKNYIWRLRLSDNSNACTLYPDGKIYQIGVGPSFFPSALTEQEGVPLQDFDFKEKNFFLKDATGRFKYQFKNEDCPSCPMSRYCHSDSGEDLEVPKGFCDQLRFFGYGFFELEAQSQNKKLLDYPVRFPTRGVDSLGMAATVAQIGVEKGLIKPIYLIPGEQLKMASNKNRLSNLITFRNIWETMNVTITLEIPEIKNQLLELGITEERIKQILDFIKLLDIRVFPRDLGLDDLGELYIYHFVPVYRDFEQIDNLLFDKDSKRRKSNRAMKSELQ